MPSLTTEIKTFKVRLSQIEVNQKEMLELLKEIQKGVNFNSMVLDSMCEVSE